MRDQISSSQAKLTLFGIAFIVALLLIFRSIGLYPTVFSDEYFHSVSARIVPFSQATYPNYLFYLIYSITIFFGDGFLEGARLLNVISFVSATPFIYLVARKVATRRVALLITTLSILAPINSYTAYFMPESLYFLFFWVFTWLCLNIRIEHGTLHWSFIGAFFGFTALIKPHALFLLPPLATFFLLQHRYAPKSEAEGKRKYLLYIIFCLSALGTKFILGFILAGQSGLTFFGASYTSQAPSLSRYMDLTGPFFENGRGHLLSLVILFSVPVAQLVSSSNSCFKSSTDSSPLVNVALYTLLIFAFLVPIVALYTASRAMIWPAAESNFRLHLRYYNFAFPLFLVVAASQIASADNRESTKWRMMIAIPIGIAILYALYTRMRPFNPHYVDSPAMYGMLKDIVAFYCFGGLSFAALALWIYGTRPGAKFFLYVFMPLAVTWTSIYANKGLRQQMVPNHFDHVGMFAKRYLSAANVDFSRLHVASSNPYGLFKTLFYLEDASREVLPDQTGRYDLSKVPRTKEWLLLLGDHTIPEDGNFEVRQDNFVLINVRSCETAIERARSQEAK